MNTLSSFFRQLSNSYIIVLKVNIWKLYFFHLMIWVRFILIIWQPILKFFCFVYFLVVFNIDFDDFISLELTRVNLDRNIFSKKCGTNIYFFSLYRGLVHASSSPNLKNSGCYQHCFCCKYQKVAIIVKPKLKISRFQLEKLEFLIHIHNQIKV